MLSKMPSLLAVLFMSLLLIIRQAFVTIVPLKVDVEALCAFCLETISISVLKK